MVLVNDRAVHADCGADATTPEAPSPLHSIFEPRDMRATIETGVWTPERSEGTGPRNEPRRRDTDRELNKWHRIRRAVMAAAQPGDKDSSS